MESWKAVPGFERYEASDPGRVRGLRRGKILKPFKDKDGYLAINVGTPEGTKRRRVHQLIARAWVSVAFLLLVPSIASAAVKFGELPRGSSGPKFGALPGSRSTITPEAFATPYREVVRIVGLLPKPEVGFVEYGCGDARWCVVAAETWGCRCYGIEIDPDRAAAARRRVREAGLDHLITIVEGDAITTDVKADVGVAYLYSDTLAKMRPKFEKLRAFASYRHEPPGLPVVKNGDSWIYTKSAGRPFAIWNGQQYFGRVCSDPNCGMCNSIQAQLSGKGN